MLLSTQTFIFLDDNARSHRARAVPNEVETNGIPHLSLLSLFLVLNCIEREWTYPLFETFAQLKAILPQLWVQTPQVIFNILIDTRPRRCQAVIDAHGGFTTYQLITLLPEQHILNFFGIIFC